MPRYKPLDYTTLEVQRPTDTTPFLLECTLPQATLSAISRLAHERTGSTIYELAENNPRDAYIRLSHLFKLNFIDTNDDNWSIGSPYDDGQQAFDGLTKYLEEKRAPDPDVEEIDLVISVWKRGSLLDYLRGYSDIPKEILRFRVEPPDLASF